MGLFARALERCQPRAGTRITRLSMDILGVVPVAEVEVSAWIERPGRRVELLCAEMTACASSGPPRTVARATAWRLQTMATAEQSYCADSAIPQVTDPSQGESTFPLPESWRRGFVAAVEWQSKTAYRQTGGPTLSWMRLKYPLVSGESTSDFQHVMSIVDVANGIGARHGPEEWTFLNTDVTVYLFNPPLGVWVGLAAETSVGVDGIAMSSAVVCGQAGPIGRVVQNVLVQRRDSKR